MMHRAILTNIEHVLLRIRPREDYLGAFLGHDPDGSLRRSADLDVPRPLDAVSARRNDELVTGLQGGHGIGERVIPSVRVPDDTLRRDAGPIRGVAGIGGMQHRPRREQQDRKDCNGSVEYMLHVGDD